MDSQNIITIILGICGIFGFTFAVIDRIWKKGGKDSNISDRVCNLEKEYSDVCKDIKTIRENHLEHIQADISTININLAEINTTLKFLTKEK